MCQHYEPDQQPPVATVDTESEDEEDDEAEAPTVADD